MKEIKLSRGFFAIVDDEDYEYLSQFKWHTTGYPGLEYASRCFGNQKVMRMHRELMDCPSHLTVDHINGNRLDNRRSNLRIATIQQNCFNRKIKIKHSSIYTGIYKNGNKNNTWRARIRINGRIISLGTFPYEEQAALAYNVAAKKYFGEFAKLNKIEPNTILRNIS